MQPLTYGASCPAALGGFPFKASILTFEVGPPLLGDADLGLGDGPDVLAEDVQQA
jgi:hypothetical protein